MKVVDIERIVVEVPFTPRQRRITQRTVYNWQILELCRVETNTGHVGWGETLVHYTHRRVSDHNVQRVLGRSPAAHMFDDAVGAGLQMALFDVMGKIAEVPVCQLLGTTVRDATPLSWWCSHAAPDDWGAEARDAVAGGYTSCKTKPRPWWDIIAQVETLSRLTPPHFKLDLDPNGSLVNAAAAVPLLQRLAEYDRVAMFETPIPQHDILGNRQIRARIERPLAMHFGSPPYATAVREEVCDGFVVNGGATQVLRQGTLSAEAGMPFWLQLVGNGLTTIWAAHLGAVLSYATWPTISCINLYSHQLLKEPIEVTGGYQEVPAGPGLGIEVDEEAVARFRVSREKLDQEGVYSLPTPRLINTVVYPDGNCIHMVEMGLGPFMRGIGPVYAGGVRVEATLDDGSREWADLYRRALRRPVCDRWSG